MSPIEVALLVVAAAVAGAACGWEVRSRHRRTGVHSAVSRREGGRRILLPFTGVSISRRALEAAVRLAVAEDATIMPAYLARVPRTLPLDVALPQQCLRAMPLLEAIEQRAASKGVPVDARVGRGRTYRDALRSVLDAEHVDRVIVSATADPQSGLNGGDLQWLLTKVPAEVLILRPDPEDHRAVTADAVRGHF